jgi:hemolysin III
MYSWARKLTQQITVEELANTLTSGAGLICSLVGFVVLIVLSLLHGGRWEIISCAIYGVSLVSLYAASTLYHGVSSPRAKQALLIFDHCAIYLLIAGTYTPFLLVNLRGSLGWSLFGTIWGVGISGILFKLWFADRFPILSTSLYLAMGWLGVLGASELNLHVPHQGVLWLCVGGLVYSLGVIFFACRRIPHHHMIWHLMVLAGSACHFIAVLYAVFPSA